MSLWSLALSGSGPAFALDTPRLRRAYEFADAAHSAVKQLRKYSGEPYIVHPAEVASIVATVPHTEEMLIAALLHDTLEDTEVSPEQIEAEFGAEVLLLVEALTDVSKPEDGNRKVRKEKDRQHTKQGPPAAKTIKLADLISNARSIIPNDPAFAKLFIAEKKALLEVLTAGDPTLFAQASQIVADYYNR